ncbi:MAG: hypothetical protein JNK35_08700 [Phycisphaerae bacterium]|nr:hypothetical protein [Phycisphaerae bacterium]
MLLGALVASLLVAEGLVRAFVTVRDVGPSFAEFDPTFGTRLKPSFATRRVTPEFVMDFSTNSLGFRGPEPRTPRPLAGTVLFLGDSFTMGYGVTDGLEFPALLRAWYTARLGPDAPEVLNAGIGGTGNGHWLLLLRSQAAQVRPAAVVLQLCSNDEKDNQRERLFAIDSGSGALRDLPPPTPRALQRFQMLAEGVPGLSHLHLYGLMRQVRVGGGGGGGGEGVGATTPASGGGAQERTPSAAAPEAPPGAALAQAIVAACIVHCRSQGWPVVLLSADLAGPMLDRWRAFAAAQGVDFLIVPDKKSRPDLYFRTDGHWHAAGHALAADLVRSWLQARGLAPNQPPQADPFAHAVQPERR